MIARGFKPVAWVGGVGAAALCCYMLSLQVAAERAELASLERRIVATQQSIRSLQTELGTRGRLSQLEQWNSEVLALSAPVADQFLESNVSLARFDVQGDALDNRTQVRMASAEAAPTRSAPAARAPVRNAAAEAPTTAPQAMVRRASLEVPASTAAAPVRPVAVQARSTNLLAEDTIRELRDTAVTEDVGGRRN